MKFGKLLVLACADNSQLGTIVLRYKALKKTLKKLAAKRNNVATGTTNPQPQSGNQLSMQADQPDNNNVGLPQSEFTYSAEHAEFISMLNEDLNRFNTFFMEKEEELVIRMEALKQQVQQLNQLSRRQLQVLRMALVELHGELVLCLHWTLLNSAAFMKIIKKYDKMGTGPVLREALQRVIQAQPFASTSIMQQLVKRAEEAVSLVADRQAALREQEEEQHQQADSAQQSTSSHHHHHHQGDSHAHHKEKDLGLARLVANSHVLRHTQQALNTWATLSSTASSPSTVLPVEMLQQLQSSLEMFSPGSAVASSGLSGVPAGKDQIVAVTARVALTGSDSQPPSNNIAVLSLQQESEVSCADVSKSTPHAGTKRRTADHHVKCAVHLTQNMLENSEPESNDVSEQPCKLQRITEAAS